MNHRPQSTKSINLDKIKNSIWLEEESAPESRATTHTNSGADTTPTTKLAAQRTPHVAAQPTSRVAAQPADALLTAQVRAKSTTNPVSRIKFRGGEARDRQYQKMGAVIRWLVRWRITDWHVIALLLGLSRSTAMSTIAGMVRAGLIGEYRLSGLRPPVLHLTAYGLGYARHLEAIDAEADGRDPNYLTCPVFPSALPLGHPHHDLLTQRFALDLPRRLSTHYGEQVTGLAFYSPGEIERQELYAYGGHIAEIGKAKIPDAVVKVKSPTLGRCLWAVEIQEAAQKAAEIERITWQYLTHIERSLLRGNGEPTSGRICGMSVLSTSKEIIRHYNYTVIEKISRQGLGGWRWENDTRRWRDQREIAAPHYAKKEVMSRVHTAAEPDWMGDYYYMRRR